MDVQLTFGILTVSDSCHQDSTKDESGPRLNKEVLKYFPSAIISASRIVPDDLKSIKDVLLQWCDSRLCNVIFTTGGTGFSKRDVTPEATREVIEKEAPGLAFAMISKSFEITPMAMLSRAVCGIRYETLIINLPGSEKAAAECFGFIKQTIPHAVALITDQKETISKQHIIIQHGGGGDASQNKTEFTPSKVNLKVALRKRSSPYAMIEVSEAKQIIRSLCVPSTTTELVPFEKSINRVLAEDVYALEPIPPFRASIKDGYAVKVEDGNAPRYVKEAAAAGDKPFEEELQSGEAVRISTGAVVPPGANAVVQVEDTRLIESSGDGTREVKIEFDAVPVVNQDIREIGSDVPANSLVLRKFEKISPCHIGVLAMLGKTWVKVYKRKSVGIISTGNELKDPREELDCGQIRDANKFTLMNLLAKYSYNSTDCGVAKDNPDSVKNTLEKAFHEHDIVITSGGVSMGEFDVIKQVLIDDFAAEIEFARVNMKPGKPTTFAVLEYKGKRKLFFGLPGNPVSCGVTCLLFVVPALRFMERYEEYEFPTIRSQGVKLRNNDSRPEYHRVTVSCDESILNSTSTGNQISSRLNSLVGANGLALIMPRSFNSEYEVILFDDLVN